MSSLWTSSVVESGILRKKDQKEKLEELLVFGYACKLFRDDEKALEIDQGKHLIPWMADNSLKIDRYDGRGALSDLSPYESSKEGYDAMRWLGLSEADRRIEQLCDEERYFALHKNEEDDALYKEEERKRSLNKSKQFGYNYEDPPQTEGPTLPPEEDDEPFIPPPELDIPVNMTLPTTVKQNARIEKTALFISKEGPQMEILLKTKQAANPQFAFLTQDDLLYRYYRHVLMAIKTGRYKVKIESLKTEQEQKQEEEHYLHPSLASVSQTSVESTPVIPFINYKPSADCAYSKLVNRIQGNQPITAPQDLTNTTTDASGVATSTNGIHPLYNHPAWIQHYQQYGYYPQYDANNPYFAQFTAQYEQYQLQQYNYAQKSDTSNPYAQIVSKVKAKLEPDTDAPNGLPVQNYNESNTEISRAPILYTQTQSETITTETKPVVVEQTIAKQSLFALAQYSNSESENDEDDSNTDAHAVVIPPADIQLIIDKMASYVAKNGTDFEAIVSSKGDPRFVFLTATHAFHSYYKYKLKECNKPVVETVNKKEDEDEAIDEDEVKVDCKTDEKIEKKLGEKKGREKKVITPVCFSIKKPRDTDSVSRDKSALPIEDSTDDEEEVKEDEATTSQQIEETRVVVAIENTEVQSETENETNSNIIEIEDPIMELIDLTDDLEEKKDHRRAEDRLKDKLAVAARDKLATKNRALQMERKKRAAAFLSQLKPQNSNEKPNTDLEIRSVRSLTPEDGELNNGEVAEDVSRLVHYIDAKSPVVSDKEHRSRSNSNSTSRHKSNTHHRRKSHKRSHSKKRKREHRSHDHKKSKRRHRSRSRSVPQHRKRDCDPTEKSQKSLKRDKEHSSHSSDCETDSNVIKSVV